MKLAWTSENLRRAWWIITVVVPVYFSSLAQVAGDKLGLLRVKKLNRAPARCGKLSWQLKISRLSSADEIWSNTKLFILFILCYLFYFLRKLCSFNICRRMLRMFYESVVASAILFAVVCWGSRLRVADANRLNKLIRKASDIVGVELDSLTAVSDRRMPLKVRAILQYGSHPLHNTLVEQRSSFSQRLIAPRCTTECHRKSFLPVAIKLYNSSLWWSDSYTKKQKNKNKNRKTQNKQNKEKATL